MTRLRALWTELSVGQIICWALLGVAVLGYVVPLIMPPPLLAHIPLFIMGTGFGDPRVVQRDYVRDPAAFTVAWVTDSSPTILRVDPKNPDTPERVGLIPEEILKQMPEVGGRPLNFAMYMQVFGPKAIDKYFEAEHALSLKPDLLIYGVNPTFDFTPWSMMAEPNIPASLAPFGTLGTAKWTLLFASPGQLLQSALIEVLPVVEERFDLAQKLEQIRDWLDPFDLRSVPPPPAGWNDLMRWRAYYTGQWPQFPQAAPSSELVQMTAMRIMDLDEHAWGKEILRRLVADARRSGIPR